MKTLNLLLPLLLLSTSYTAQDLKHTGPIKNAKTISLRIDGDCPMCEERIERVAFVKNEAEVDWVVETHLARVTFDSTRTSLDAIMQRVAHAGYDNELYLAPKQAYDKLPGCCQYERTLVHAPVMAEDAHAGHEHGEGHEEVPSVTDKLGYQGTPQGDAGAAARGTRRGGSAEAGVRCLFQTEGCAGGERCCPGEAGGIGLR
ncbi:MAG: heavy-metal-associated domain-containing protein [Flavobacteriales bacterium]